MVVQQPPKDIALGPRSPQVLLMHQTNKFYWQLLRAGVAVSCVLLGATTVASVVAWLCWPQLLAAWIATELGFAVYLFLQYRRLNEISVPLGPRDVDHWLVFKRFLNGHNAISKYMTIPTMLSTWFYKAPLEDIKLGNVGELLAYGFFYKSRADCAAEGDPDFPERLARMLEQASGLKFPEGYTPGLRFMFHLWDPVYCQFRPLVVYAFTEVVSLMVWAALTATGFQSKCHQSGLRYFTIAMPEERVYHMSRGDSGSCKQQKSIDVDYSNPIEATTGHISLKTQRRRTPAGSGSSSDSYSSRSSCGTPPAHHQITNAGASGPEDTEFPYFTISGGGSSPPVIPHTPFLFFHGVGMGLLPYLPLLLQLTASGRPVIVVQVRHLSMRLCTRIPGIDQVVDNVVDFLRLLGVGRVSVVAHSYGTFMASRLVQRFPDKVNSLALIDPVCLNMFTGKLVKNFVYCSPWQAGSYKFGSGLLTWLIAREPLHAASVQRGFHWTQLHLWPDHLPHHTLVSLAAHDPLVPAQEALIMLENESPATEVVWHARHSHATFLTDLACQEDLAARIERQARAADQMWSKQALSNCNKKTAQSLSSSFTTSTITTTASGSYASIVDSTLCLE